MTIVIISLEDWNDIQDRLEVLEDKILDEQEEDIDEDEVEIIEPEIGKLV